jgi:5-methylthioadenosine/S-adenosylhomocysteine deaminase
MKLATLMQRATHRNALALVPGDALDMAWRGGAEVLGMKGQLGVLAVGARADVVVIDLDRPHLQPLHHIDSALVFCALPSDVRHVVVDGRVVVRDRVVTTVDVPALLRRCRDRIAVLGLSGYRSTEV